MFKKKKKKGKLIKEKLRYDYTSYKETKVKARANQDSRISKQLFFIGASFEQKADKGEISRLRLASYARALYSRQNNFPPLPFSFHFVFL